MAITEEQEIVADAVLNVLTTVISFIFLGLYISSFLRMKAKATDPTSKLYLRYVMSCSLIFIISYTIRYLFKTCTHDAWTDPAKKSAAFIALDDAIGDVFFALGHAVFYLIMILRLFFVFRGSKYALTRTVILALALCWSLVVLVDAAYFIVLRNAREATREIALHFLILVILDIMLGAMLILIFTRKLIRMGLDSAENVQSDKEEQQHVQHDNDDSDDDQIAGSETMHDRTESTAIQLTQTQRILVSAAGRFVVLCGMTILFINVQFLCQALYILAEGPKYSTFAIVLAVWYMIVLVVEYHTIYLSFPTTTNQYEIVCGLLDGCVTGMVRARMLSKLQRQRAEQNGELRHFCGCCVLQREHFPDENGVDV